MNPRSRELFLDRYDTDKIANHYLERYDPIFAPLVNEPITLLEIGIFKGGSLLLWKDYFPRGNIVGIDAKLPKDFPATDRIRMFQGLQVDTAFLSRVAGETAPSGYDIIIDDASHVGRLTKIAFWHLFDNHLKPGGLYVIEDWGTGYFDGWPDGKAVKSRARNRFSLPMLRSRFKSHDYGMVGLIKELIDEQGAADLTKARIDSTPKRKSKFESMLVTPYIVFVKKA